MKEQVQTALSFAIWPVMAGAFVYLMYALVSPSVAGGEGAGVSEAASVGAFTALLTGIVVNAVQSALHRHAEARHWKAVEASLKAIAAKSGRRR